MLAVIPPKQQILMRKTLSKYKYKKLAIESMYNGLRLHRDSLLLLLNGSYPSSLQLSILAMEEIAKSKWVEHLLFSQTTNNGLPDPEKEEDVKAEQEWLKLLYFHPKKQFHFIRDDIFQYTPSFAEFVQNKGLDILKQNATYVGLNKKRKEIDVNSNINIPLNTKIDDVVDIVSLVNQELIDICKNNIKTGGVFSINELIELFDSELFNELSLTNLKSTLKSNSNEKAWNKLIIKKNR
jgi:AbiV family abortive infection protein